MAELLHHWDDVGALATKPSPQSVSGIFCNWSFGTIYTSTYELIVLYCLLVFPWFSSCGWSIVVVSLFVNSGMLSLPFMSSFSCWDSKPKWHHRLLAEEPVWKNGRTFRLKDVTAIFEPLLLFGFQPFQALVFYIFLNKEGLLYLYNFFAEHVVSSRCWLLIRGWLSAVQGAYC